VLMPPKFQPTRGGARRRIERAYTTHHLRDENTESEDGCSSSSDNFDSDEESGNEATRNPVGDTEPIRGDLIKGKMLGIAEEVTIINSEFPKCHNIKGNYKFYGLGWMSEATGHYYPTIVRELYANYIVILEGLCTKGNKLSEMSLQGRTPVQGEMVDISTETINRMLYGHDFTPASISEEAHVPILAGIDMETYATKNYDLEKSRDESQYELKLHKHEVFGSSAATQLGVDSAEMLSSMPQFSKYAFTPTNLARVFKNADRQEPQIKVLAEQLGLFVDSAITVWQPQDFPIPRFEELEDDEPFIDLLGKQPKAADSHHSASNYDFSTPNSLSTIVTIAEVSRVAPPQTVCYTLEHRVS
ncbi:hypothetical protein HAX54_039364, partial [Datura stramonium]|nr:hypothetical protein [Datura stramonium]